METVKPQEIKKPIIEGAQASATVPEESAEKTQPWKKIIDKINADNEAQPLEGDFFICKNRFYSHSLAA